MSVNGGNTVQLERSIGLVGATALVVGAVIGAGIYILLTKIALKTGDALWLAFAGAMFISLVGVIPLIQLAGALPRAGGGYFFTSRLLSPMVGTVVSCCIIFAVSSSTALVSLQVAKLTVPYLPGAFVEMLDRIGAAVIWGLPFMPPAVAPSESVIAVAVVVLFYGVYLFGLKLAMGMQVVFAAQFIAALLVYAVVGLFSVELTAGVTSPAGTGGMIEGLLLCYSTCFGLQVVAELGEEVKNARRNIPLALIIGGAIVAVLYIAVGQVFVSAAPYDPEAYAAMQVPLRETAEMFLPGWFIPFLTLGAFTAALTSLNAGAIAIPREIFAQARDRIAPEILGKVDARTHAPQHAVALFFGLVILILFFGMDVDYYGLLAAIGILVMSSMLCIASLFLPGKYPERYRGSYIVVPKPLLWLCTIITILVSLVMFAALFVEQRSIIIVYGVWIVFIAVYYKLRTRSFGAEDWARVRGIPGTDEFGNDLE